jgi:hypothetical protein
MINPYWTGVFHGIIGSGVFLGLLAAWGDWIVARDKADLERLKDKHRGKVGPE